MGDRDENDMLDTSRNEKSEVQHAWLGFDDLELGLITVWSGLFPAVPGMVNWLRHDILLSPSFSLWFPPSSLNYLLLILHSTITEEHEVKSSFSISAGHDYELTPDAAYTE